MNRAPPPPTGAKRAGPPPPPPKIGKKVPIKIQVPIEQTQSGTSPQGQLPEEQLETQVKDEDNKQINAINQGSTHNTNPTHNFSQKQQVLPKQQQVIPQLIDEVMEADNSNSMNNLEGEFNSQISNNRVESLDSPVRIIPVAPKRLPNPPQTKNSMPAIRKPLNMPKPPPPTIRPNLTNGPEQQNNKRVNTTTQDQNTNSGPPQKNGDFKNLEQDQLSQQKSKLILETTKNDDIVEAGLNKQQSLQKQAIQIKKPTKSIPPPGLTPKIGNRGPPKPRINPIKQKVEQQRPPEDTAPEKSVEQQIPTAPVPITNPPPALQNKQKPKPVELSGLQNIKSSEDLSPTPQSAKIQPARAHPNNSQSSEQAKHNLTPKYTNLKNKLKDFSMRKSKMLESSQSESQINSETYSEMQQTKHKSVITENAQSMYTKPLNSIPIKRDHQVQYANVQIRNETESVKSFAEDEAGLMGDINNNKGQLNELQRVSSQQIFPQHQKQQVEQVENNVSRIKSSIPYKEEQRPKNQNLEKNQCEELILKSHTEDNNQKSAKNVEKTVQIIGNVNNESKISPGTVSQKELYQTSEPIKQLEEEHKQPHIENTTLPVEDLRPPVVPPKKLVARAPIQKPKSKPISYPPPLQPELQHRQQAPASLGLTESIKQKTAEYKKQSELLHIEQLLEVFNSKKEQYLSNAQQLTEICSTHREEEYKQVAAINDLLLKLEQQNIKLKSILLNY